MPLAAMSFSGTRIQRLLLILACVFLCGLILLEQQNIYQLPSSAIDNGLKLHLLRHLSSTGAQPAGHDHKENAAPRIEAPERLHFQFDLTGYLMVPKGRGQKLTSPLVSSLVYSFSPEIEREAARKFLDPPHQQVFFANSPAVEWFRGELVLVSRIWLDRERYEAKQNWPPNHFADNYLYTQRFDRFMRPIDNGSIIGIPAPKQWWVGDGPIEPRTVKVQNKLFITFNSAMAFKYKYFMDYTVMWDYLENRVVIPKIKGGTPMKNATEANDMPRDKHWMALLVNNNLHFVQNLDPLRVMKCTLSGKCKFVHEPPKKTKFVFEHSTSHLRGGTPFVHYSGAYYFSIAHSTMYKNSNGHRFYTAHIVVMRVKPYRIVYVSNDLKVHNDIYTSAPMVRPMYIDDGFIFPVGLILENPDEFLLGVHANDFNAILLRFRGLRNLMETVIEADELAGVRRKEPGPGAVHKHVHDVMEEVNHKKYIHAGH